MNTQQVEQMTGISRQNIRYYEKEGLLSPKRDEGNGYRIYSREDVEILKRVKMLRMLGMQLDVIRSVLHGEESLEEAVVRQRERLLEHQKQLKAAADMCEKIRRMGEKDLDVDVCLEQMEAMERQGGMFARFRDDYKKAAEWEDKKEFSFYVDANIKTKEEILRSVWEYGQTHGMELQKVHGREEALFLADGQMYRAACLRLRPRERGKEEETKRRALIVCRRCTREKRTGRMRFLQAVHIVLRNIRRQKKRSALQVLVCMAAVCFGMLYQDNIDGSRQQLAELDEIYTVSGEVWNYNGSMNSGLRIAGKYADALRESPYLGEMEEKVDLNAVLLGEQEEVPAQAAGINCLAAGELEPGGVTWEDEGESLDGTWCVMDKTFMEKRGLELGDQVTAEISGYQEDEMAVVLLTVPLCTVKLEIAGYADLAAEDVLCPLSEARQWFDDGGVEYMPSRMRFEIKDAGKLNAFKKEMDEAGFMEVTAGFGATGIYKGNALVVDDRAYVEAARSIEKNIRFLMAFYPLVLALMMVTGYIVSCLVMQDRRMELAVMRALGTGRRRVFLQIFSEHVLMAAAGCACGALVCLAAGTGSPGAFFRVAGAFLLCYSAGACVSLAVAGRFSVIAALMGKE